MWGASLLAGLTGTGGRVVLILAAISAWTAYHRHDAASRCQEQHYIAKLEERERELAVAERLAADARDRADEAEREMEEVRAQADAILSENGAVCVLPDDVADRLRAIR